MKEYIVEVIIRTSSYMEDSRLIERKLKRSSDGSGAGFGERDLTWNFKTKRGAENFQEKALKILPTIIKNKRSYSVSLHVFEDAA